MPQRLLGAVQDRLRKNFPIATHALAVAGGMRYVTGLDEQGRGVDGRDPPAAEPRLREAVTPPRSATFMRAARGGPWRRTCRRDGKAGSILNAALRPMSTEVALDFSLSLAHPGAMGKDTKVIAANAAFYAAFSAGDFAGMERMWADDDAISCIHPGWPAIIGRATVIGSWRDILQDPQRPQIVCAEPQAIVDGDSARVLCIEIVDGTALAAANHFRRVGDDWRLVHHQSSPIAQIVEQAEDDRTSHRVH